MDTVRATLTATVTAMGMAMAAERNKGAGTTKINRDCIEI